MMKWKAFLSFFFLILVGISTGLGAKLPASIPWDLNRPIGWADFMGDPPLSPMAEAAMVDMKISWHVQYVVSYDPSRGVWSGKIDPTAVEVENTMDPAGSWVISGKESAALLDHERRHFDLNEVYARRLREELSALSAEGKSEEEVKGLLQEKIKETADRILDTLLRMQELYDQETAHGTDLAIQTDWDNRIDTWLYDPGRAPWEISGDGAHSGKMIVQSG